jgi:uncharacterized membrane protein
MKREYRTWFFALFIVVLAACVRLYQLELQSLWNDEMFSLDVASRPLGEIQERLVHFYHHPPLFFYLAHLSLELFGPSAWALRFPSALFGALTAGVLFLTARRFFSFRASALASILLLAAPFHIAYSQEGRPYALAGLLCLISCASLFALLQRRGILRQVVYVASTAALLYTHHWGAIVFAAQLMVSFWLKRRDVPSLRSLAPAWLVIALGYLPEYFALRTQIAASDSAGWFWVDPPGIATLYRLTTAYSGTYFNFASSVFILPPALQAAGCCCIVVILIAGWMQLLREDHAAQGFFLLIFASIILLAFFLSFWKPELFVWYRYTVIAFPLLCVIVAGAAEHRPGTRFLSRSGEAAGLCLALIGVAGTFYFFSGWQKGNAKDVSEYVGREAAEFGVPAIIRPKPFAPLLNYYYRGNALQYDEAYLDRPLGEVVDTTRSFIYISLDIPNEIRNYMDGHFDKLAERRFPGEAHMGMVVGVYRQKPDQE